MVLCIMAGAILLFKCIIGCYLLVVHQRENVLQSLESIIQQSQWVVTTLYCSNLLANCATILANLVHLIRGNTFGLLHNTGGSSFSVGTSSLQFMEFFSCPRSNRVHLLVLDVPSNLFKCSKCKFRYGPTGASKVTSRILVQRLQSGDGVFSATFISGGYISSERIVEHISKHMLIYIYCYTQVGSMWTLVDNTCIAEVRSSCIFLRLVSCNGEIKNHAFS